ncbi:unnamed protein product [Closterium sp. Naga37s-1]|nr:unnamed protein product [Closterium sp. Naga37s-1]
MIRNSSRGSSLHLAVPLNPTERPSPRDSSMSQLLSQSSPQSPWSSQHHHARGLWRAIVASKSDWLLFLGLLPVNVVLSLYLPPYQRFIPPETLHSPRYPVVDNAGATFFTTASVLAPLLAFLLVLLPQRNLLELHKSILGLLSAVQTTWLAATLLQCAIGRPRPSFLTACLQGTQPVVSPPAGVTCVPPPTDLYYFRKSFPSAHAAVSFSAAVFLLLFLSRTIQRSFPQRPSPLDSPSHRPSHRHNHSPQHRTQSHQECNQPLQHPHQSHQSPGHPNANATSSPHNLLVIATPSPHNNFTAARLRDSLRASHLWRVPAVAWPLALAAGAGLADLDTYSNAPGDILAGVALGTLVAFIAYWRFFSPTRCGSESGISPWLGFELLRDSSPPREPPSADTRLEVLVPAPCAATAPATAAETAFATVPVTVGVAAAGRGTAGATGDAKADDSGGKEG